MALRKISTLGSLWLGLATVFLFSTSKASLIFLSLLLSRSVAALRLSVGADFLLQILQAHMRHWPSQCARRPGGARTCSSPLLSPPGLRGPREVLGLVLTAERSKTLTCRTGSAGTVGPSSCYRRISHAL
ncbi:hypothetical protein FQN60_005840 [Etheostoma spectabile]|uniref:Uncharacterized protein n=1 Tax=Etheostoma spectabile TaxID=54343 RepID=A0A5J5CH28_9PERO|nr:hypothetical protein FQN60_005840 [Etheostoma spectabile]